MFRLSRQTLANVPSVAAAITATAGGTKATAFAMVADVNRIAVCATIADSVLLPPALSGSTCFLANDGVASANVFGQGTDTINGVATATATAFAAARRSTCVCVTDGAWLIT